MPEPYICTGCAAPLNWRNLARICKACRRAAPCAAENCANQVQRAGLCSKHDVQRRNGEKVCLVTECLLPVKVRGLCATHYQYDLATGKGCSIEGCDRPLRAKGLCNTHYNTERTAEQACSVAGCVARVRWAGKCTTHYRRTRNVGKICRVEKCTAKVADRDLCGGHAARERNAGKACLIDECSAGVFAAGLCSNHYQRRTPESTERAEAFNRRRRAHEACLWISNYSTSEVLARTDSLCHLCAEAIDGADRHGWHVDHIIPLSLGGPDCAENVAPAHDWCNLSKHAAFESLDTNLEAAATAAYEAHHGHAFSDTDAVWPCTEPCALVTRARTDPALTRYAAQLGIITSEPMPDHSDA